MVIVNALTSFLPTVTTLPFGIDAILANGMGYFFFIAVYFPPLTTMYNAFLFVVAFKIGLKVFAMIPVVNRMLYK